MCNFKLTPKQRETIYGEYLKEDHPDYEYLKDFSVVDEQFLSMDNHGCNCTLIVFERLDTDSKNNLYGFIIRASSEEVFFDEDEEIYILEPYEIKITKYKPINFDKFQY